MAVNLVYIKGGRKMMRPVLTKEEYMSLRDSEENRRADKWHMVQMNYSLACSDSPEEERAGGDFPLKGCKTQSSTVGMDIDFNPEDADYEKKMADVPHLILEKKYELGLLMLERSATKGFHIVFRRHPELSQEENLRCLWMMSCLKGELRPLSRPSDTLPPWRGKGIVTILQIIPQVIP